MYNENKSEMYIGQVNNGVNNSNNEMEVFQSLTLF